MWSDFESRHASFAIADGSRRTSTEPSILMAKSNAGRSIAGLMTGAVVTELSPAAPAAAATSIASAGRVLVKKSGAIPALIAARNNEGDALACSDNTYA